MRKEVSKAQEDLTNLRDKSAKKGLSESNTNISAAQSDVDNLQKQIDKVDQASTDTWDETKKEVKQSISDTHKSIRKAKRDVAFTHVQR